MTNKRFVKPGDKVEQFAKVCEVQSDKAAVEITSRFDGTVKDLKYAVGQVAKVGSPLMDIEVEEEGETLKVAAPVKTQPEPPAMDSPVKSAPLSPVSFTASGPSHNESKGDTLATPAVRRVAKEFGVNLNLVTGSGPQGRVLKGDVLDFIAAQGEIPVG